MPRRAIIDQPALVAERDRRLAALDRYMDHCQLQAEDWARRAGVAPNTIRNFRTGRTKFMSDWVAKKLVEVSNGTMEELLGHAVPGSLNATVKPTIVPPAPKPVEQPTPASLAKDLIQSEGELAEELRQVRRTVEDLIGIVEDLMDEVRLERREARRYRSGRQRD